MAYAGHHRALLVPLLAVAHLAIVAVLLRQQPAVPDRPASAAAMMVTAIPAPGRAIESAPPPMMDAIAAIVEPPAFDVVEDVTLANAPCAVAANVEAALRRDATVAPAVARIPAAARSVANALLLWDGAWARPASVGGDAALGPIRAVVEAQIRAAPAPCRNEPVIGPRLIVVPDGDHQIVLAFGSGQWRWDNIL